MGGLACACEEKIDFPCLRFVLKSYFSALTDGADGV